MRFCTKAFVLKNISSDTSSATIPIHIVSNFNDLLLADPLFFISRPVDILLEVIFEQKYKNYNS